MKIRNCSEHTYGSRSLFLNKLLVTACCVVFPPSKKWEIKGSSLLGFNSDFTTCNTKYVKNHFTQKLGLFYL